MTHGVTVPYVLLVPGPYADIVPVVFRNWALATRILGSGGQCAHPVLKADPFSLMLLYLGAHFPSLSQ